MADSGSESKNSSSPNLGCSPPRTINDGSLFMRSDSAKYWRKFFEKHDRPQRIPRFMRKSVLESSIGAHLVSQVEEILKHNYDQDSLVFDDDFSYGTETEKDSHLSRGPTMSKPDFNIEYNFKKNVDYKEGLMKAKEELELNMYGKFLNKTEHQAGRWKYNTQEYVSKLSLDQKCSQKTHEIAHDFVTWMNSLGGDSKIGMGVEEVVTLFEIGFSAHAADSLCVKIRELNAVPASVALAKKLPEMSYSALLYKQLYRDMTTMKRREDMFAFGTMLPPELRTGTLDNATAYSWIDNRRVPERLANMAVVWEGIEKLFSTVKYCHWLENRSYIEPPKYLVDKGCIGKSAKAVPKRRSGSIFSTASRSSSDRSIFEERVRENRGSFKTNTKSTRTALF